MANTRRRKISRKPLAVDLHPDYSVEPVIPAGEPASAQSSSEAFGDELRAAGDLYAGEETGDPVGRIVSIREPDAETPSDAEAVNDDRQSSEARDVEEESLQYCIDDFSEQRIVGWIRHRDKPLHRCVVTLKEGDRVLSRTTASQYRADLTLAGVGDGYHSFILPIPESLHDYEVHWLDVIEEDTGFHLTPEPLSLHPTAAEVTGGAVSRRYEDALNAASTAVSAKRLPLSPERSHAEQQRGGTSLRRLPSYLNDVRVLFDISDLVYYIGNHPNLTGIQRVQSGIVLSIITHNLMDRDKLTFISFNHRTRNLVTIPTNFFYALLQDLFLPEERRMVPFPVEEARYGLLPGATEFDGAGLLDDGKPSVLCLLGAAWVHQDYLHRVLTLKRRFGTRFVMTVHDLIPVYAADTCDQDTVRVFEDFMRPALRHADHVLSVSESTARDIRRYVKANGIAEPPLTVTRNGSSFTEFMLEHVASTSLRWDEMPERFVLFVATIEGRKNHQLMLEVWQRLIAIESDPPHLICVGRLGWKSTAFINTLVETGYLGGRIVLLRDISDTDLQMLYERCLFTVCPTLYEGWGLPVGEALAFGKICVCSDRASIPEVAGEFGVYIDVTDADGTFQIIRELISNEAARTQLEGKIRSGYKPIAWSSVAERVVEACIAAARTKWEDPYPYTLVPYSAEVSFARLDRHLDGSGEPLLARIADMRRGYFLPEPLHGQSFVWGEEARSVGHWSLPEDWGTWSCRSGAEIAIGLGPDRSSLYYVALRIRVTEPVADQLVTLTANGERAWQGTIGQSSRNLLLRVTRYDGTEKSWRLRLGVTVDLSATIAEQIRGIDPRTPTVGFERLAVVPADDIRSRLDILHRFLC